MRKVYHKPKIQISFSPKEMNQDSYFQVSKEILLREIAGEYILVPVGQMALNVHGMIRLSESGLLLWKQLQNKSTKEDLIETILREYDVQREIAEMDVLEFLAQLKRVGVLIEENGEMA